jgi:FkbM family methyltransferase
VHERGERAFVTPHTFLYSVRYGSVSTMVRAALLAGLGRLHGCYRGPIKRFSQAVGIDPFLVALDERARVALTDTKQVSVGGARAAFLMTTRSEYHRLCSVETEAAVIERCQSAMEPDGVFYDIGANVGTHSCLVGTAMANAQVVAVEPHPTNADRLRENLALNDIQSKVFERALAAESGAVDLAVDAGGAGKGKHRLTDDEGDGDETLQVETVPGDVLVAAAGLPTPTVVKIDVEGAEVDVLRGLADTLEQPSCRAVCCEVHPQLLAPRGEDPATVETLLRAAGFAVERFHDRGTEYFVHATRD